MTSTSLFGDKKEYSIVLGSGSPRRQELLKQMGIPFTINLKSIDETYPSHLEGSEIARYIAQEKASPYLSNLSAKELLITADTVVWHNHKHLAKADNKKEALEMLESLSSSWHEVITAVCFTSTKAQELLHEVTKVKFKKLSKEEITYYVEQFKPFDKAGAYGIQEWIGLIGIEEIQGSYSNVVGLPTQRVYNYLSTLLTRE